MAKTHRYAPEVTWTGNTGTGTSGYAAFSRNVEIASAGKPTILGSADPAFRGDPARWNPEDMLVSSLSVCHMLWFLHLAAMAKVIVTDYVDHPEGFMEESKPGDALFTSVVLHPKVTTTAPVDPALMAKMHHDAHEKCFIGRSVNFPVTVEPVS